MKLKLKQCFCSHDFLWIAKHKSVSESLFKCQKCDVFMVQHYGLGTRFKTKAIDVERWDFSKYTK